MSDSRQTTAGGGRDTGRVSDDDLWYRAVRSRDPRFDGWFFVAVTTTGIYCRPSCASVTPRRDRVRFYQTAAAAQRAGFRACKRCRPDASPGSPEWNRRGDVVARAMREIADGTVERSGVAGLAARLGYSVRQLNRVVTAELGAGPLEIARAQRAQTARLLLETTDLPMAEVAFAAGFGSVRQFNDTVRAVFAEPPSSLRARGKKRPAESSGQAGGLRLRLAFRRPFESRHIFSFLGARAVPGVEACDEDGYRRALSLPHGAGLAEVRPPAPGEGWLAASVRLEDLRDLTTAVKRLRQLFDLDADPTAVAGVLERDSLLAGPVSARPGLRVPGAVAGDEIAFRAVLGQQVSVAGARTLAGRLAAAHGEPLPAAVAEPGEGGATVRCRFPSAERLASLSAAELPVPAGRARALLALAGALAAGEVSLAAGAERAETARQLLALEGIGPWTVSYVSMRALADPDAFMASDLGVRRALERAGQPGDPRSALEIAEPWRPYRAYGMQYLWAGALGSGSEGREKVA